MKVWKRSSSRVGEWAVAAKDTSVRYNPLFLFLFPLILFSTLFFFVFSFFYFFPLIPFFSFFPWNMYFTMVHCRIEFQNSCYICSSFARKWALSMVLNIWYARCYYCSLLTVLCSITILNIRQYLLHRIFPSGRFNSTSILWNYASNDINHSIDADISLIFNAEIII